MDPDLLNWLSHPQWDSLMSVAGVALLVRAALLPGLETLARDGLHRPLSARAKVAAAYTLGALIVPLAALAAGDFSVAALPGLVGTGILGGGAAIGLHQAQKATRKKKS